MDWKLGGLTALLLCACSSQSEPQGSAGTRADAEIQMAAIRTRTEALEKRADVVDVEFANQAALVAELAALVAEDVSSQTTGAAGSWIIWQTERYFGSRLMGASVPDRPLDAFVSQEKCLNSARSHVKKQPGAKEGETSFTRTTNDGAWLVQMVCLPSAIDPRRPRSD